MSKVATTNTYGVLAEAGTLKFQRHLRGPIERVWKYLVESDLRRQWLAAGKIEMEVGTSVEFIWRNDELNNPPSQRPAGFPEEQRMQGRIAARDAPRNLAIAWNGFGEVSYTLEPDGEDVLLTMMQRGSPNRDIIVMFAAGSHTHFDILAACLNGKTLPDFWKSWGRLQKEYNVRIAG